MPNEGVFNPFTIGDKGRSRTLSKFLYLQKIKVITSGSKKRFFFCLIKALGKITIDG